MRRTAIVRRIPARPVTGRQWTGDALPTPRAPALRIADGKARMSVPLPKRPPARDKAYRRLVAAQPCINCKVVGFSQAAHGPTAGAGLKSSDRDCFPLCCDRPGVVGCHFRFDQYQLFFTEERATKAREWAALTRAQIEAEADS